MADYGNANAPLDIDEILKEVTIKVERVRVLYEQYFMGIERMEPLVQRKEVQRTMLLLQQQQIRNTGLRFRFNTLLQKWQIYITYWNRILREIENGTYTRHVSKAQRAAAREGKVLPPEIRVKRPRFAGSAPVEEPAAAETPTPPAATPPPTPPRPRAAPPPLPPGVRPPPPPPGATASAAKPPATPAPRTPAPPANIPGVSENELRQLHARFVDARRNTGEVAQVSYEVMVSSLSKQVAKVLEKPGIRRIRFDVAVQDGRAVLKTIAERTKPAEPKPPAPKPPER